MIVELLEERLQGLVLLFATDQLESIFDFAMDEIDYAVDTTSFFLGWETPGK